MRQHARSKKPEAPKHKELAVTPEQIALLVGLNAEAGRIQERMNLVCAGIVAGHGYSKPVRVVAFDNDKNTLTIVEP